MSSEYSNVNSEWRLLKQLIAFACFFFSCTISFSQKVSSLVSKEKIVLGEQFFVKIKVEGVNGGMIQQDFQFPDTVNHLEILSDSIDQIDNSTILHTLIVTSFDSGSWQLPSFQLLLTDGRSLETVPHTITVLPIDISNLQDYHDIKDILEIIPENNWWVVASIVLLALISLFAVIWFMNDTGVVNKQQPITETSLQQLFETFMKRLNELESSAITDRKDAWQFFAETSGLTRSFIDKAKQQNTTHLTTGEYILTQKGKLTNVELENNYFQFLRLADAVKFAKYFPPAEEIKNTFPVLRNIATSVYQSKSAG